MSRLTQVMLLALLLNTGCNQGCVRPTGGSSSPIEQRYRILLFCDLSESTDFAATDLETVVRKVLLAAPEGSEVKILAIHAKTTTASPIFTRRFNPEDSGPKETEARTNAAIEFTGKLKAYRNAVGSSSKQSCILDSLPKARQFELEGDHGSHRLAIGYLSDMIEDCPPPVRLPKGSKDLANSLLVERLGDRYEEHIKVGDARVVVCQPGSASGASSEQSEFGRMKLVDRRDLWQRVFGKAGVRREIVYPDGADGCVRELLRTDGVNKR